MSKRITNQVERQESLTLYINGNSVSAYPGETIASVLFAENISVFYRTRKNEARAAYCNMGTCFECQVKVKFQDNQDSTHWLRACMTQVEAGMQITCGEKIESDGQSDD